MQNPTVIIVAALLVPAIAFSLLIWAFIRTKLKLGQPYCRDCGADLGPADVETCPDCGHSLHLPDDDFDESDVEIPASED